MILLHETLDHAGHADALAKSDLAYHVIRANDDWRKIIGCQQPAGETAPSEDSPVVFAPIPIVEHIMRQKCSLADGIFGVPSRFSWTSLLEVFPPSALLSRSAILLPFGMLRMQAETIKTMFGADLFIRPVSGRKTFPGQVVDTRDEGLDLFCRTLEQIFAIRSEELVVIDRRRPIEPTEWRFWIIGGRIASLAPYGEPGAHLDDAVPGAAMDLARWALPRLEAYDPSCTLDIAVETASERASVVEVNAVSSSGLYGGADILAIYREIQEIRG